MKLKAWDRLSNLFVNNYDEDKKICNVDHRSAIAHEEGVKCYTLCPWIVDTNLVR